MIGFSHKGGPEVSVLMSCYNAEKWLNDAIDSVLSQTFGNFEFILIDDGSTDETWGIIQNYRDRDSRIVAISKRNTGLADSLNVGIAQAKGVWIARLDADDLCEPTRLEKQINFVHKHPEVVLLGTGFTEIDEHGKFIKNNYYPSKHHALLRNLERMQRFFPHSSAFYQRDIAQQVKGYNSRFLRAEDKRLWLLLACLGRIACLREPLVKIRKHSEQISLDDNGKRQLCDGTAASVCHFLRKMGCEDLAESASEADWLLFLNWLGKQVDTSGFFESHITWVNARAMFFSTKSRLAGAYLFGRYLLRSGHGTSIVWGKIFGFGSPLPKYLAREWMKLINEPISGTRWRNLFRYKGLL